MDGKFVRGYTVKNYEARNGKVEKFMQEKYFILSFFPFSSFCRYSFDPKLNFPFFWSVQDDIFENFPQKFRAQFSNGFIVSSRKKRRATFKFFGVLSNVVGSKMISRNQF